MGGGVNPIEWVLPPLALTHVIANAGINAVSPRAKIIAPGSPTDKAHEFEKEQIHRADMQKAEEAKSAADYLAANPGPQTPEQEEASRRRANKAGAYNLGGRRASQLLASDESAVGV